MGHDTRHGKFTTLQLNAQKAKLVQNTIKALEWEKIRCIESDDSGVLNFFVHKIFHLSPLNKM